MVTLTVQQAMTAYLQHLRVSGRPAGSVRTAASDLRRVLSVLASQDYGSTLGSLTPERLAAAVADPVLLRRKDGLPKAAGTCRALVAAIRGFALWSAEMGLLDAAVAAAVPMVRPEEPGCTRALTPAEIAAVRSVVDGSPTAAYGGRDRLLLECLLTTGLRVRELVRLTVRDVDLVRGQIGLGQPPATWRILPLAAPVQARFATYLDWRAGHVTDTPSVCFLSGTGHGLSAGNIASGVEHWFQQAGLVGLTPRIFRTTVATHLFARTHDLRLVRRLLGFHSLQSTVAAIAPFDCTPLELCYAELAEP